MSSLTDYLANRWLNDIHNVWMSLHTSNPDLNGAIASEVKGGGYERINVNFTDPDQRIIWNKTDAHFRGMPACKISFIGGWGQQYNGRLYWYVRLEDVERVQSGQKFTIKAGEVAISLA